MEEVNPNFDVKDTIRNRREEELSNVLLPNRFEAN